MMYGRVDYGHLHWGVSASLGHMESFMRGRIHTAIAMVIATDDLQNSESWLLDMGAQCCRLPPFLRDVGM